MTRLLLLTLSAIGAVALSCVAFVLGIGWLSSRDLASVAETATTEHDGIHWTYTVSPNMGSNLAKEN